LEFSVKLFRNKFYQKTLCVEPLEVSVKQSFFSEISRTQEKV
jgi:hypothetical protein